MTASAKNLIRFLAVSAAHHPDGGARNFAVDPLQMSGRRG